MLCVPYKDHYIYNLKPVTVLKLFNYLTFCFNNGVSVICSFTRGY